MASFITSPYPVFFDTDGTPLQNGSIYIGQPNLNPETSPVTVYWDDALTQPAAQPIRTLNGYPSRAGTPSRIYTSGPYNSILVKNRKGAQIYYENNLFATNIPEVNVVDFGAVGDGVTIDDVAIQAALNSGAKSVYVPPGTYLLDNDLEVPEGVEFYGAGSSSILRMVGRDTNGRNSNLFAKYQGQGSEIATPPAMVVINGSNAIVRDLTCDGNGLNNYADVGSSRDYIDEVNVNGYCGVRVGRLALRTGPSDPASFIDNSHVRNVNVTLTAWCGIIINGIGYRYYQGLVTTDEDRIGARYCTIEDCFTYKTGSNNIATFGAKNCVISRNRILNNIHAGIKVYVRSRDILIDGNEYSYDQSSDVSWRWPQTPAYNREYELSTRSDAIAVGHSDYNTLIANVSVVNNKLNGDGKIKNGINVYSNTSGVKVTGNHVVKFINALAIGVTNNLDASSNTFSSVNYTYTDYNVGAVLFGSDLQFTARAIEETKSRPAPVCVQHFSANVFEGVGCNHIRGNDWGVWTALDAGLQAHFTANTYNNTGLTGISSETVKPINVNSKPSGVSGNPNAMVFEADEHIKLNGFVITGDTTYYSNQLWTFVRPYGVQFTFEPDVIGSVTPGTTTYNSTRNGIYCVRPGMVDFSFQVGWTAQDGAGNLRVTGLPLTAKTTANEGSPASLACHCSGLTFSNQLTAIIQNGASTVDFYEISSGNPIAIVDLDPAVTVLRVSGSYFI